LFKLNKQIGFVWFCWFSSHPCRCFCFFSKSRLFRKVHPCTQICTLAICYRIGGRRGRGGGGGAGTGTKSRDPHLRGGRNMCCGVPIYRCMESYCPVFALGWEAFAEAASPFPHPASSCPLLSLGTEGKIRHICF